MTVKRTFKYVTIRDNYDGYTYTFWEGDRCGISNFGVYSLDPEVIDRFEQEEDVKVNFFVWLWEKIKKGA